ncbi:MAG: DUF1499 domain-containing protein [Roseobacter sp.]|nr:DUF1499 domain-containing protein [Roseobacter sp.]
MFGSVLIFAVLLGMAYIRIAPLDPERWHQPVEATANEDRVGGAVRVIGGDEDTLRALDRAARDLKRTHVLAGSVAQGRISYVTRSLVFGFPDVTTIELTDGQIRMYARLRYGTSDLGVNRNRLERLIAAVQ